ncbi:MAG TPA: hypothetical protein VGQ57_02740, partial [Polyangiaceae bacterium]|nr:hypothetical protein [Polyangiaceae bacterium]
MSTGDASAALARSRVLIVCPKYYPTEEGLAHYTTEFARHLAARADVAVWTSDLSAGVDHGAHGVTVIANVRRWNLLGPFASIRPALEFEPDRILIQFVPFMYAERGGINFTLVALAWFWAVHARLNGKRGVEVMFHETWFPFAWEPKAIVMTVCHRAMAFGVAAVARRNFCSTFVAARMVKKLLRP